MNYHKRKQRVLGIPICSLSYEDDDGEDLTSGPVVRTLCYTWRMQVRARLYLESSALLNLTSDPCVEGGNLLSAVHSCVWCRPVNDGEAYIICYCCFYLHMRKGRMMLLLHSPLGWPLVTLEDNIYTFISDKSWRQDTDMSQTGRT